MRAWICAAALLFACSPSAPAPPRPLRMVPSSAAIGAAAPVVIEGNNLEPVVRTNFNAADQSVIDPAYTATLGGIPLEQVAAREDGTLTAIVPAGLGLGSHELVVVNPDGVEGRLPQAFRVVTTFDSVARFQFEPIAAQRAAVPFGIGIAALDERGRIVEGFEGTVALTASTGTITPSTLGPFRAGRLRGVQVTAALPAASLVLSATDEAGHAGSSSAFEVSAGPPQRLEVQGPDRATAGECAGPFSLALMDATGAVASIATDASIALSFGPPEGAAAFADESCAVEVTSLLLPAGSLSAEFYLRLTRAGPAQLRASVGEVPAALKVITVGPAAPARLGFRSPSWSIPVGGCSPSIRFGVTDAFGNAVTPAGLLSVVVTATPPSALTLHSDAQCGVSSSGDLTLDALNPEGWVYARGAEIGAVELSITPLSLQPATQLNSVVP